MRFPLPARIATGAALLALGAVPVPTEPWDLAGALNAQRVAEQLLDDPHPITTSSFAVQAGQTTGSLRRGTHVLPPTVTAVITTPEDSLALADVVGVSTREAGALEHDDAPVQLLVDDPHNPTVAVLAGTADELATGDRVRSVERTIALTTTGFSLTAAAAAAAATAIAVRTARARRAHARAHRQRVTELWRQTPSS